MVMYLKRGLVLWGGLLLLGLSVPVHAHNGAMAIAVPVEGIKVDGDLSDWPAGMRRYPIALPEYGVSPRDGEDYQGSFRLGYNEQEQALYIAVEVKDHSSAFDGGETSDGCEIYLAMDHQEGGGPVAQWVIWGDSRRSFGSGKNEDARVEVRRGKGGAVYEWRLDLRRINPESVPTQPATVIAFDVVVTDKDADGSFSWMAWGRGTGKVGSSERVGDVVLVGRDTPMGRLRGTVKWEDMEEGLAYGKVRIQSLTSADFWAQVPTDSQGVYIAEVPPGKYRVEAGYRYQKTAGVEVEVKAGATTQVAEMYFARPPLGKKVPAGPGTTVVCPPLRVRSAGPGFRRQAFRTYTQADGLQGNFVLSLYQDRTGNLWVGTEEGGVSRFDGATFSTLTKEHGLPGGDVGAIAEDHEGRMWFSTIRLGTPGREGLCRYDGKTVTRFDTTDGLPTTVVYGIDIDVEGAIWLATPDGAVRYDGHSFTIFTREDGLISNGVLSVFVDSKGRVWLGSQDRPGVSRFDGQHFTTYTTSDGLPLDTIFRMREDRAGNIWFLHPTAGATCYDGQRFVTYGEKQGLLPEAMDAAQDAEGRIWITTDGSEAYRLEGTRFIRVGAEAGLPWRTAYTVLADASGALWFGTGAGLSRYLGDQLRVFTAADFPGAEKVTDMAEDRDHHLWLATDLGLTRYDGKDFATFTPEVWPSGPPPDVANCILVSRDGSVWMGRDQGLHRFDGRHFTTYTTEDGLAGNIVSAIAQDGSGILWVASWGQGIARQQGARFEVVDPKLPSPPRHVSAILADRAGGVWIGSWEGSPGLYHYDGTEFVTHTPSLYREAQVTALAEDQAGTLWTGSWGAGVGRYDGQEFTFRSVREGAISNWIGCLLVDQKGHWWAGTRCGVTISDGKVFQNLTVREGLPSDQIRGLFQDHSGAVWIATEGGLCRYQPQTRTPEVMVTDIVTDRRLGPVSQVTLPSSQDYLRVEYRVKGLDVVPGRTVYRYRLAGYDDEWRSIREERVEYGDLPIGQYEFQLKAVDQDLNYSEPYLVKVEVAFPYAEVGRWTGTASACLVAAVALTFASRRRRAFLREQTARLKAQEELNRELEEELQTAHTLQMDLMPRESPRIAGLDLAGRCIPANHVGGDLFQYFHQEGKLSIALADVTGHAMEAAIPMVMFSGVLRSQIEISGPIEELFGRLNRSLHHAAGSRTFVCFAFGTIDTRTSTLRLSSAAFPYPYHFSSATGEIAELRVDAYPLGVRPDTRYAAIERQLAPGDYLVFCSDGIIEATDGTGAQFGYERTAASLRSGCAAGLSAEAVLERIVVEVREFRGETPQGDDQTVVVLRVES